MRRYLICYWAERNDECKDFEEFIDADNIMEALEKFTGTRVFKRISSVSEIANPNYVPNLEYIIKE